MGRKAPLEGARGLYIQWGWYVVNFGWWRSWGGQDLPWRWPTASRWRWKSWIWCLNTFLTPVKRARVCMTQFTFNLFLCHCSLHASTVGFIYLFIWWCSSRWPNFRVESTFFLWRSSEGPTKQATFSCHHFQFGCSRNRPAPKKESWC